MTPARRDLLLQITAEVGTPCYVYFLDDITARTTAMRQAFAEAFQLSYAVKCNPNLAILQHLKSCADSLDVSSAGELRRATSAGWSGGAISFTGPGKRDFELQEALDFGCEVVVESLNEARRLSLLASQRQQMARILVRLAPGRVPRGFGDSMAGKPTQFGVDVAEMATTLPKIAALPALQLVGFHIYSGSQCLEEGSLVENYQIFADVFGAASALLDCRPEKLIFGAGIGIPYYESQRPVDLAKLASGTLRVVDELRRDERLKPARLVLELGRFWVGEAGYFVTRVVDTKHSRGVEFAICDGGLNNHLAASGHLGSVIHRNYRMQRLGAGQGPPQTYHIVGPLCTSIDTLARGIELPILAPGDAIAIFNSGAYGLSASPIHFISHRPPSEVVVSDNDFAVVSEIAAVGSQ
jgi:diaminopimelate decarboxylase